MQKNHAIQIIKRWLEDFVVELDVCPFAGRELQRGSIRFTVCDATTETGLLANLESELVRLRADESIETTLLIHPEVLQDFTAYNEFLSVADLLLEQMNMLGEFQIASFHPDYQFAGTRADDAENFTNRAPFPLLHLLREASVTKAVEYHPDVNAIPAKNIQVMNQIGALELSRLLARIAAG